MAIAFGKNPAVHDEAYSSETTPDSIMMVEAICSRNRLAASQPQSSRAQSPDAFVAAMADPPPPSSSSSAPSAPAQVHRSTPPPLDLHGADMEGAAMPLRRSRGDPRGRGDRGGDNYIAGGAAAVSVRRSPTEAALTPRASCELGAWAAAVAEAEAETEAEFSGDLASRVASRLSSGEFSDDMLQTLMRMQVKLTLTLTLTPTLTLTLSLAPNPDPNPKPTPNPHRIPTRRPASGGGCAPPRTATRLRGRPERSRPSPPRPRGRGQAAHSLR